MSMIPLNESRLMKWPYGGRRKGSCTAPGPDNLSLDIWKRVPRCIIGGLAEMYSRCLEEGKSPDHRSHPGFNPQRKDRR